jgi:hypothetical protein
MSTFFPAATWRRLDTAGQSAAGFAPESTYRVLCGGDVWTERGSPVWTQYRLWHTTAFLHGTIEGWFRGHSFQTHIKRDGGSWLLNGVKQEGLDDLTDLDLGFTPATNWFQLRRVGDEIGMRRALPVVWWDLGEERLIRLPQFYTRRSATTIWYESPEHEYEVLLEVSPDGFVKSYPGLWERLEA